MTRYTLQGDGRRRSLTGTFLTRRVVGCDDVPVRRLLFETDDGTEHALLVSPDAAHAVGLRTGDRYRFRGVLDSAPPATTPTDEHCPDCGTPLRRGCHADAVHPSLAAAATRLDLKGPVGVVDDRTRVTAVDGDRVDDWRPMPPDAVPSSPAYVCPSCGRQASDRDLRAARFDDGVQDAVDSMQDAAGRALADSTVESAPTATDETLGMAAGGSTDATTFRRNVEEGYTPQPEAVTDEGLFAEYHVETGERAGPTEALFAPRYAAAVSDHPLTGATERYVSVGLDSTLSAEDFERPRLDLVVALDVSGSMDGRFDAYYYDERGRHRETDADGGTKLDAAVDSLCALTRQLRADDRLGVVLYDHRAHVAKPLRDVGSTDVDAIRGHVRSLTAGGGTNLADGFEAAVDLLSAGDPDPSVERRVVFLTDMMPNAGTTADDDLASLVADAAIDGVHTTFVGMGLDENAELAAALSGVRGANHYTVHSAAEFERRLGEEFDYMVTPLVYDLGLRLETDGYEIDAVHGAPSADAEAGRLLHVGTLFPSPSRNGEARGGVVLVRVEPTAPDGDLDLVASWTERTGRDHVERVSVDLPDEPETFDHDGVRTAVALSRYARALRAWAADVHGRAGRATGVDDWQLPERRGAHERASVPLTVTGSHAEGFAALESYLTTERDVLDEPSLDRELDLLDRLLTAADESVDSPEVSE